MARVFPRGEGSDGMGGTGVGWVEGEGEGLRERERGREGERVCARKISVALRSLVCLRFGQTLILRFI